MKGFTDEYEPPKPTLAEQLAGTMFDDPLPRAVPLARRDGPTTSKVAAHRATDSAPTGRVLALRLLAEHPAGLTEFELAELAGPLCFSIGRRRRDLARAVPPLVEVVPDVTRPAPSGSPAQVWRLSRAGWEAIRGG